jgi:formylglycine-generating enzyme required for sulfatase activity
MKQCPTCNRTFDDTMSFCLVDGAILSAPFDPRVTHHNAAGRQTDPAPTEMLKSTANIAEPTLAQQSERAPMPLPPTVASSGIPSQAEISAATPQAYPPTHEVTADSVMDTIKASLPKPISNDPPMAFGSEPQAGGYFTPTQSAGGKRWAVIAAGVLAIIVIGAVVWFIRGTKTKTGTAAAAQSREAKATDKKAVPGGQSFTENISGTPIEMVYVSGGTFLMGSPLSDAERDKDEGPQAEVTVQNFEMSKYEITQAQYRAVMGSNPSSFKGDDLPVDSVSWTEAVEFCRKLSKASGREYRLPTEAEWEYACRSGTKGPYPGNIESLMWYDANSGNQTHPVGQKQPNGFGLYDMNGNVWEWCQSKYAPYPYRADDGREDLQSTDTRVMRGGSWRSPAKGCRSAYRRRVPPEDRTIGFRIVVPAK